MSASGTAQPAWAPLRVKVFRALWLAVLVSNTGAWMQTVGAQWLLVHGPHAAILVALVQTADMLPDVLFAYVGGVLADTLDRRWLLLAVQGYLVASGLSLTVLTYSGRMPPSLLLALTFLIGAGSAFSTPAYQASIPDLIPRRELASASALGALNVNLAQAVGPALAGLVIVRAGVGAVFALNTVAFLAFGVVIAFWHPPERKAALNPEPIGSALLAGVRYVRNSPVVRRLLLHTIVFVGPASALWALLPLVASRRLGLGASGYGLLLGALGAGAVLGAVVLPRIRGRWSGNALLSAASLAFATVLAALVLVPNAALGVIVLIPAGTAWIAVLSGLNAAMQLFLPGWVRARGLSVYQIVFFGSQAAGAVAWGILAGQVGLKATFLIAAAVMAAGAATVRAWPLFNTRGVDRSLAVYWPEPHLVVRPGRASGPVLVVSIYTVGPENERAFLEGMSWVRRSRLRTGAVQWGLFRDGAAPQRFVETFVVASWKEHSRQHNERLTGADREYEARVDALSNPPPETIHLFGVNVLEG